MKFSIKGLFSKCDQISQFPVDLRHLLKKSLMKSFIFLCSDTPYYYHSKQLKDVAQFSVKHIAYLQGEVL